MMTRNEWLRSEYVRLHEVVSFLDRKILEYKKVVETGISAKEIKNYSAMLNSFKNVRKQVIKDNLQPVIDETEELRKKQQ